MAANSGAKRARVDVEGYEEAKRARVDPTVEVDVQADDDIAAKLGREAKDPCLLLLVEKEFTLKRLQEAFNKLNGVAKGLGLGTGNRPVEEKANFHAYLVDSLADILTKGIDGKKGD